VKQRQAFLEAVKKRLLARRDEITKSLASLSEEKVADKQVKDVGDEALSLSMEKLTNTLQMTELDEIKNIDEALARLTRGEYGICVDCGGHISDKRLEASPYSARCIVCQEALEG
jgi:DnaK suppressor protein